MFQAVCYLFRPQQLYSPIGFNSLLCAGIYSYIALRTCIGIVSTFQTRYRILVQPILHPSSAVLFASAYKNLNDFQDNFSDNNTFLPCKHCMYYYGWRQGQQQLLFGHQSVCIEQDQPLFRTFLMTSQIWQNYGYISWIVPVLRSQKIFFEFCSVKGNF